ncbi:hypothetical protein [Amycolatopsis benzoatilytica]|uniref:hypothetical protein n=1 Tax=Amycolatopsis benzoatilytica TaxID=346045 RepID=UPI000374D654|nr:hypothetical protein [Amycolatopsis benzoatilytica]
MLTRDAVLALSAAGADRIPLLTVEEFFAGNTAEDSIAPNQVGYGRPDLAEIAARLTALAADPAVAWVRVQLHEEMFEDGYDGLAAESVAICAELSDAALDTWLDGLEAEPVWEGFSYPENDFCEVPAVPAGFRVRTLGWD